MHTSSATLPMCGKSSQISWPDLPNFLKAVLRAEADQRLALQLRDLLSLGEGFRHGLAVHFGELGFVVEGFQVRRAAGLVEEDDALGLGGVMQRVDHAGDRIGCRTAADRAASSGRADRARDAAPEESAAVNIDGESSSSIPGNGFVQIQNGARHGGHGGQFGGL